MLCLGSHQTSQLELTTCHTTLYRGKVCEHIFKHIILPSFWYLNETELNRKLFLFTLEWMNFYSYIVCPIAVTKQMPGPRYANSHVSSRLRLSIMINGHLSKQVTLHFWKTNDCLSNHNVNNAVTATKAAI